MGLFGKSKIMKKLHHLEKSLYNSFSNVKNDTSNIFQWLDYLHKKNQDQEQHIEQLKSQLNYMPKTKHEIKHIIDQHYSSDEIHNKINNLNQRIDELHYAHKTIPFEIEQLKAQLLHLIRRFEAPRDNENLKEELEAKIDSKISSIMQQLSKIEQKKPSFKEKIVKQITRKSKDYLKGMIVSLIKKYGKISAYQLKEIVVEEQNLCSKSSFYRILLEIEDEKDIGVMQQGKEKIYLYKLANIH